MAGFASTEHGWVQSYGSRCVRPPILFGDAARPEAITTGWATSAQRLTGKPVKGMLTEPVTILAWSFVRDDEPLADTARQVVFAVREEVRDLEAAGIRVVQGDEPALRPVPAERLWVNPNCGLKTRGYPEVEATLRNITTAVTRVRAELE